MGKNQRWFTYPRLVIARIPSGLRLSPVITWKFAISIVQLYYTTLMAEKLLESQALSPVLIHSGVEYAGTSSKNVDTTYHS